MIETKIVTKTRPGRPKKGQEKLPRERVTSLVNAGITDRQEIANITGSTVEAARLALNKYFPDLQAIKNYRENRAEILAGVQEKIISELAVRDLKTASVRDLTIAYGTLYDKERIETGQSTSNVAVLCKVVDKLDKDQSTNTVSKEEK